MKDTLRDLHSDERAALQYSDVVMAFGVLVAIAAVSPWMYAVIDKLQGTTDPLTSVILGMTPALLVVALILSIGVSARQ